MGLDSSNIKDVGERIISFIDNKIGNNWIKFGTLGEFDLMYKTERTESYQDPGLFSEQNLFCAHGMFYYTYNNGILNTKNPETAVKYFLHSVDKIPGLVEKYQKESQQLTNDISVFKNMIGGAWDKEDKLKDLKKELTQLEKTISNSLKKEKNIDKVLENDVSTKYSIYSNEKQRNNKGFTL
jgi:hypothetical protein